MKLVFSHMMKVWKKICWISGTCSSHKWCVHWKCTWSWHESDKQKRVCYSECSGFKKCRHDCLNDSIILCLMFILFLISDPQAKSHYLGLMTGSVCLIVSISFTLITLFLRTWCPVSRPFQQLAWWTTERNTNTWMHTNNVVQMWKFGI